MMDKLPIAAIFIDVQQGFLLGQWMQYFGTNEVTPIKAAFDRICNLLPRLLKHNEKKNDFPILLRRVPFHLNADFEFVPEIKKLLQENEGATTQVIKPGNDILYNTGPYARTTEWCQGLVKQGVRTVVIGGCTLTSCVRVSASEIQTNFGSLGLQTVVDLSLCGARLSNYNKRCRKCMEHYMLGNDHEPCLDCRDENSELKSPVDLAIENMKEADVNVMEEFPWDNYLHH